MKLIMGLAVALLGMLALDEGEARAQCTTANITAIAQYYWTVKPLCQTQSVVDCAAVAPSDPKSPCRVNSTCMKYVLHCKSNGAGPQSVPQGEAGIPASYPPEDQSPAPEPPPAALPARPAARR